MPVIALRRLGILTAVLLATVALGAESRQAALPLGKDVLARNVQALGGVAAHQAIKSVRARGKLAIPSQNISGDFEAQSMRPDKMITKVSVPGIGSITGGYNGKVGWTLNPIAGPALLEGRELSEAADDSWFDNSLFLPDRVKDATTLARTEFDGHPAFKVKVTFISGRDEIHYFDATSGLELGSDLERATPQGVIPTVHFLRDYKKFGAVLIATTQVERALGFETVTTIATVEFDVVDAAVFELPAEIKALIK